MCNIGSSNTAGKIGEKATGMVSDAVSEFCPSVEAKVGDGRVTMDVIRLQACAWRMANDYKLSDVANIMGTSSTWLGSFCSAYGTCERPYASQLLKLLCVIGYPYGYAVSIVHSLYPDLYGGPAYWHMNAESKTLMKGVIRDECQDDDLSDRLIGVLCGPYTYESPFKIHGSDTCPMATGADPDESEMRFACATCSYNHLCQDSVVKKRGGGVGLILDNVEKDRSVYVEVYKNSRSVERARVVTKRFHKIVFDNCGFGLNIKFDADIHHGDVTYDWKRHNEALSGLSDLFFDGRTTDDRQQAIRDMMRHSGDLDLEDGYLDFDKYCQSKDILVSSDFVAACTDDGVHYIVDQSGEVLVEIFDLAVKCGIKPASIALKVHSLAVRKDAGGCCVMAAYGDPDAAELGMFVDRECVRGVVFILSKMSKSAEECCGDASYGSCDKAASMLSEGYLPVFVAAAATDRRTECAIDPVETVSATLKLGQAKAATPSQNGCAVVSPCLDSDGADVPELYDEPEYPSEDGVPDPGFDMAASAVGDKLGVDRFGVSGGRSCFDMLVERLGILDGGKPSLRSARGLAEMRARLSCRMLPFHHILGLPGDGAYYDPDFIMGLLLSDIVISGAYGRSVDWPEWVSAVEAEKHMMRDIAAEESVYYKAWTGQREKYGSMNVCELLSNLCRNV